MYRLVLSEKGFNLESFEMSHSVFKKGQKIALKITESKLKIVCISWDVTYNLIRTKHKFTFEMLLYILKMLMAKMI